MAPGQIETQREKVGRFVLFWCLKIVPPSRRHTGVKRRAVPPRVITV